MLSIKTLISHKTVLFCGFLFLSAISNPLPLVINSIDSSSGLFTKFCSSGSCTASVNELNNFLDSLGYFNRIINSLNDTVYLQPKTRTIITKIINNNDTINIKPTPYSSLLINDIVNLELKKYGNNGYPFAKIRPSFSGDIIDRSLILNIDKSTFVKAVEVKALKSKPLKESLVKRSLLFDEDSSFNYSSIMRSIEKLKSQKYINSANFSAPMVKNRDDSTTVILPLSLDVYRGLLFDGALSWLSEPYNVLTGEIDISLINLLSVGEEFRLKYYGDKELQTADGEVFIPYILKSNFSLTTDFSLEISRSNYGYFQFSLGTLYDIWNFVRVGISGRYYELNENNLNRTFSGIKLSLIKMSASSERGAFTLSGELSAGSGLQKDGKKNYNLSEFHVEGKVHSPLKSFAIFNKIVLDGKVTNNNDTLHVSEKVRVGGSRSIRGYRENEFAFISAVQVRNELRYYFSKRGAIFIFGDGAIGVKNSYQWNERESLLGYGLGVHIPVKTFSFNFEWAQNYDSRIGLGVVHFSLSN